MASQPVQKLFLRDSSRQSARGSRKEAPQNILAVMFL
jgi:hypothetical protein